MCSVVSTNIQYIFFCCLVATENGEFNFVFSCFATTKMLNNNYCNQCTPLWRAKQVRKRLWSNTDYNPYCSMSFNPLSACKLNILIRNTKPKNCFFYRDISHAPSTSVKINYYWWCHESIFAVNLAPVIHVHVSMRANCLKNEKKT